MDSRHSKQKASLVTSFYLCFIYFLSSCVSFDIVYCPVLLQRMEVKTNEFLKDPTLICILSFHKAHAQQSVHHRLHLTTAFHLQGTTPLTFFFFYLDTICPTNWTSVFLLPFWKTGCSYVLSPLFQNMQELVFRLLQAAQVWKHFMRNNCRSVCSVSASRGNVTLSGKRALCRQQLLLCGQHKWY